MIAETDVSAIAGFVELVIGLVCLVLYVMVIYWPWRIAKNRNIFVVSITIHSKEAADIPGPLCLVQCACIPNFGINSLTHFISSAVSAFDLANGLNCLSING